MQYVKLATGWITPCTGSRVLPRGLTSNVLTSAGVVLHHAHAKRESQRWSAQAQRRAQWQSGARLHRCRLDGPADHRAAPPRPAVHGLAQRADRCLVCAVLRPSLPAKPCAIQCLALAVLRQASLLQAFRSLVLRDFAQGPHAKHLRSCFTFWDLHGRQVLCSCDGFVYVAG